MRPQSRTSRSAIARIAIAMAAVAAGGCSQLELLRLYNANNGTEASLSAPLPVTLPFREVDGWVLVQGSVNGAAPIDFVLDTGASILAILASGATAHLPLDLSSAHRMGTDLAGPFGARQDGLDISIGPLTLQDQTVLAIPLETVKCKGADMPDPPFQGVLGHELFHRYVVEFDYDRQVVVLHDPGRWTVPEHAIVVPADISGRQPFVEGRVQPPSGAPYTARLHVDTGAGIDVSLFPQANDAIQVPAEGEESSACFVGGLATYRSGTTVDLAIGEAPQVRTPVMYSLGEEVMDTGQHGRIGARFLRRHNVVFDYANERMVLLPRAGTGMAALQ